MQPHDTDQCEILIVDDNLDFIENLRELFEDLGELRVKGFTDPREALVWGAENAFRLALLDIRMPNLDGIALYRALREERPTARYAFVTGYAEGATLDLARSDDIPVIEKVAEPGKLIRSVGDLLG
jgi:CheY-like chemotaxis protein